MGFVSDLLSGKLQNLGGDVGNDIGQGMNMVGQMLNPQAPPPPPPQQPQPQPQPAPPPMSVNQPSNPLEDKVSGILDGFSKTVSDYFNPQSNAGHNFWSTPVAQGLASAQQVAQNPLPVLQNAAGQANNVFNTQIRDLRMPVPFLPGSVQTPKVGTLLNLIGQSPQSQSLVASGLNKQATGQATTVTPQEKQALQQQGIGIGFMAGSVEQKPAQAILDAATQTIPEGTSFFKGVAYDVSNALTKTTYDDRVTGVYVTPDAQTAQQWGSNVHEITNKQPLNLLDTTTPEGQQIYQKTRSQFPPLNTPSSEQQVNSVSQGMTKQLQQYGFDGIKFGTNDEQVIFNQNHLIDKGDQVAESPLALGMQPGFAKIPGKEEGATLPPPVDETPKVNLTPEDQVYQKGIEDWYNLSPNKPGTKSVPTSDLPTVLRGSEEAKTEAGLPIPKENITNQTPGLVGNELPPMATTPKGGVENLQLRHDTNYADTAAQFKTSPWREVQQNLTTGDMARLEGSKDPDAVTFSARVKDYLNNYDQMTAGAKTALEDARGKLSPNDYENAVDAAEGLAEPKNDAVANWVNTWSQIRDDIATKAKAVNLQALDPGGLVDFQPRENYFPHFSTQDVLDRAKVDPKILDQLIKSGKASNEFEAKLYLDQQYDALKSRRYGHLEFHRSDIDVPFIKDPRVAEDYVNGAYKRIAQANQFGTFNEQGQGLINNMIGKGNQSDATVASRLLANISGKTPKTPEGEAVKTIQGGLRGIETVSKLGMAPLHHLGQIASNAARFGPLNTLKAMPELVRSILTGTPSDLARNIIPEVHEAVKAYDPGTNGTISSRFLKIVGFNRMLNSLRTLGAEAGNSQLDQFEGKLAANPNDGMVARFLGRAGIDVKDVLANGGKFTPEQRGTYIREGLHDTSLLFQPGDLPGYWQTPVGRLATMFKSFGYNQATKTIPFLFSEATHGNIMPLVTFVTLGTAIGTGEQVIQDLIQNKPAPSTGQLLTEGALRGANPGIVGSTLANLMMYPQYAASNITGLVGGPIVSDIGTAIQTAQGLTSKNPTDKITAERNILRQAPLAGGALSNTFAPYNSYVGERPWDIISNLLSGKQTTTVGGKEVPITPWDVIRKNPLIAQQAQQSQTYYDSLNQARDSLKTDAQQKIFDAIYAREHDANGNTIPLAPGDRMAIALLKLNNPDIMAAMTQAAKITSQKTGEPLDPIYTYSPAQQKIILEEESQLPGPEKTNAVKANQNLFNDYFAKQTAYYNQLQANGVTFNSGNNPKPPLMTPYIQAQLNAKNYNDPQVQQYFAQDLAYKNQVRTLMSAPLVDTYGNIQGSKNYGVSLASTSGKKAAARAIGREGRYLVKKSQQKVSKLLGHVSSGTIPGMTTLTSGTGKAPTVRLSGKKGTVSLSLKPIRGQKPHPQRGVSILKVGKLLKPQKIKVARFPKPKAIHLI